MNSTNHLHSYRTTSFPLILRLLRKLLHSITILICIGSQFILPDAALLTVSFTTSLLKTSFQFSLNTICLPMLIAIFAPSENGESMALNAIARGICVCPSRKDLAASSALLFYYLIIGLFHQYSCSCNDHFCCCRLYRAICSTVIR